MYIYIYIHTHIHVYIRTTVESTESCHAVTCPVRACTCGTFEVPTKPNLLLTKVHGPGKPHLRRQQLN